MFLYPLQCKENIFSFSTLQVRKNGRPLNLYMLKRMGFDLETNKYNDECTRKHDVTKERASFGISQNF